MTPHDYSLLESARLLLIEDNYGDVVLMREMFSMLNITNGLEVANDGEQALEMLHAQKATPEKLPALILLDLNLPRKDGKEVLAEIKRDAVLAGIPVVVMTSSKIEMDIIASYGLPASSYIIKPVQLESICNILKGLDKLGVTLTKQCENQEVENAAHTITN